MRDKITPEDIEAIIKKEQYYVFPGTTLTICCLTLENGFNVTGESACINAEYFNVEIGRKYARKQAFDKIWQLEGYLLKDQHYCRSLGDEANPE